LGPLTTGINRWFAVTAENTSTGNGCKYDKSGNWIHTLSAAAWVSLGRWYESLVTTRLSNVLDINAVAGARLRLNEMVGERRV
jgi:hypothetical protein